MNFFDNSFASAAESINDFGKRGEPFIFIFDFLCREPVVSRIDEAAHNNIFFDFHGFSNCARRKESHALITSLDVYPPLYDEYVQSFSEVYKGLYEGNSYLCNLTFPTRLGTELTLEQIFSNARAKYCLLVKNRFTAFSPETFVKINPEGIISTFPMKGTIRGDTPDAAAKLLSDEKERAEHNTIVDLMRNDLAMVSTDVRVDSFRYLEKIETNAGGLFQTSSQITGKLNTAWKENIGAIICSMLPAGSVTGAPKKSTVDIILRAEPYERGFYTGVCGVFDGNSLDSAVLIRYVRQSMDGLYYHSGGGITVYSDPRSEYNELIDKVYLPAANFTKHPAVVLHFS